jgi:hypothetical protein
MRKAPMMLALVSCTLSVRSPPLLRPRSASVAMAAAAPTTGSDSLLRSLFDGVVSPDAVAAACSASVEWDDLSARAPAVGRDAVRALLVSKFPRGSKLVIDRLVDGQRSGGFTWHREAVTDKGPPSAVGLRGTLFAELDADGQICYVREACEPILKPGEATEALLKAATKNADRPPKPPPTFTQVSSPNPNPHLNPSPYSDPDLTPRSARRPAPPPSRATSGRMPTRAAPSRRRREP